MSEKKYPGEIVGYVFRTNDYDAFKKLKGNREVFDARKDRIKASISENGWVRNPVVVNEKMEVIDGQGRAEALEELGMPVEYVVAEGATIDHCIALNLKQTNWKLVDYIRCYADQGNDDMQTIIELSDEYTNIPISSIACLVSTGVIGTVSSNVLDPIRNGNLLCYAKYTSKRVVKFASECMGIIGKKRGRADVWCSALKPIFFAPEIDEKRMLRNLGQYSGTLQGVAVKADAVRQLERVYNYHKSNKVFFEPIVARAKEYC